MNGFIVIDKPAGITSHDVVSRVRRILSTRKVGHTGTLDPFATGVLPVAVNDGTKAIPFLDEGSKAYDAVLRLGVATDTLDMTGSVLQETDCAAVTRERFVEALSAFLGDISQVPPMYSALKRNGQPLYKLARQGVEVEREARRVTISSLELVSFEPPLVGVRVVCTRGTYVRTLADDIGRSLGCGAALQELRRTASGPFDLRRSVTLDALESAVKDGLADKLFVSPFVALSHLADIPLTPGGLEKIRHGRSPDWTDTCSAAPFGNGGELVRLSVDGELAAVAALAGENGDSPRIVLKRVFIAS